MDIAPWQALVAILIAAFGGGGLVAKLLTLRPDRDRIDAESEQSHAEAKHKKAESAEVLAKAYSVLVDDMRKDLDRQDRELAALRDELRNVMAARDKELAAVRLELATEREESGRLRQRVVELERQVSRIPRRRDDPPPPPPLAAA